MSIFSWLRSRRAGAGGGDPDRPLEEHWQTAFRWFQERRLPQEESPDYRACSRQGSYRLEIGKPGCLAWVVSQPHRYRDFFLEGAFAFGPGNGYSAAGFLLRYLDEDNFYYLLVSNRGYFRFDGLFNREPVPLIGWTELPPIEEPGFELKAIVRGPHFSFFLNDEWMGEIVEETITEGCIGLVGQNFEESERSLFLWKRLSLESRGLVVERDYIRWTRLIPVSPQQRLRLGHSFLAQMKAAEAVRQLRLALDQVPGGAEDHLMLAEAYRKLGEHGRALEAVEESLKLDASRGEAIAEKAQLLFLKNAFLEARDYILSVPAELTEDALLWNIRGNCEYSLGNWENALEAFCRAEALDQESSLYRINRARALERLDRREEALEVYGEAARRLFREEAYTDLALVLPRVGDLLQRLGFSPQDPRAMELKALEAKMLFHEGSRRQAGEILDELIRLGTGDSAVFYLQALILSEYDRRGEAIALLEKACSLEPDYPLYWTRLAENRFLAGLECKEEAAEALRRAPDDPWVRNLCGQIEAQQGRLPEALEYFRQALRLSPSEVEYYLNASEVLVRMEREEEACGLLEEGIGRVPDPARLLNHRANLRCRSRDFVAALPDYERALELDPKKREYRENFAACCLELDLIQRAEELLGPLLEDSPSASTLNLNGNLAAVRGEYERAEASFLEAMRLEPGNSEIALNLASLYLERRRHAEAQRLLRRVLEVQPHSPRARTLQSRLPVRPADGSPAEPPAQPPT